MTNRDVESGMIVAISGGVGVIIAFLIYTMNTQGILIDEFITGTITITDLMVVVIVIWVLVGLMISALRG